MIGSRPEARGGSGSQGGWNVPHHGARHLEVSRNCGRRRMPDAATRSGSSAQRVPAALAPAEAEEHPIIRRFYPGAAGLQFFGCPGGAAGGIGSGTGFLIAGIVRR